jgi:hypothetical protein
VDALRGPRSALAKRRAIQKHQTEFKG